MAVFTAVSATITNGRKAVEMSQQLTNCFSFLPLCRPRGYVRLSGRCGIGVRRGCKKETDSHQLAVVFCQATNEFLGYWMLLHGPSKRHLRSVPTCVHTEVYDAWVLATMASQSVCLPAVCSNGEHKSLRPRSQCL